MLGGVAAAVAGPRVFDAGLNRLTDPSGPPVSEAAARLHRGLAIADLHCDLLLWSRDPLARSRRGHADLPRFRDGNVALQVLAAVTHMPARGRPRLDLVTPLVVLQGWPPATWASPRERALHQARRLHRAAARSGGRLAVVRSAGELEHLLAARRAGADVTGAVLALEGLHALEGELDSIDLLYAAGFRLMGLAHFSDNELAGSAHGTSGSGLTPLGRLAVHRMEQLGILVDLAHASPRAIDDTLALATRPLVVSHTGIQTICPGPRNLGDDRLRRAAEAGGVIGIGFWPGAVGEASVRAIARAIAHAAEIAGIDHVGLGSDFDGAVAVPFDAAGLPQLTQALLEAGLGAEDVRKVMGANALRVLSAALPAGSLLP